jgi:hypothetical protein
MSFLGGEPHDVAVLVFLTRQRKAIDKRFVMGCSVPQIVDDADCFQHPATKIRPSLGWPGLTAGRNRSSDCRGPLDVLERGRERQVLSIMSAGQCRRRHLS